MNFSKKRVSYFYDSDIGSFNYGGDHPMKPRRIKLAHDLITGYGLHKKMKVYPINKSTNEDLTNYHSKEYIEFLRFITPDNEDIFDGMLKTYNIGEDSPIFDGLFKFSQISAGGSIDGARKLNNGETDIAINWAGGLHHAKKKEASGFCYVNDIVLGILELLKCHPRVLYIDIDIHHGDGVEEAFKKTNRVMTCSFHKYGYGYFPGTGNVKDIGIGEGENYAVNFPLDNGMCDQSYLNIFKKTIDAIMKYYQPTAIVLQCGADTLAHDELGCFNLTLKGHGACVQYVKGIGKPLLVLGGGGYTPKNVAKCWTYETSLLLNETDLPNTLPETEYSLDFPLEKYLHIEPKTMKNSNENKNLEKLYLQIVENLKKIESVPSVGIRTVPPDGFGFGLDYNSYEKYEDNEDYFEDSEEEDYLDTLWNEDERDFGIDYNLKFLDETFEEMPTFSFLKKNLDNNGSDPLTTKLHQNKSFGNFQTEKKLKNDKKHLRTNNVLNRPNLDNNNTINDEKKDENKIDKNIKEKQLIDNTTIIIKLNHNINNDDDDDYGDDSDDDVNINGVCDNNKDEKNNFKKYNEKNNEKIINGTNNEKNEDNNNIENANENKNSNDNLVNDNTKKTFRIISNNKEKRIQQNCKYNSLTRIQNQTIGQRQRSLGLNEKLFLDNKGIVYDQNYQVITQEHLIQSKIIQSMSKKYPKPKIVDQIVGGLEFPRIKNFENFMKFEKACLKWKEQMEEKLSKFVLPKPLSNHYYRPYLFNQNSNFPQKEIISEFENENSFSNPQDFQPIQMENSQLKIKKFTKKELSVIEKERVLPDFMKDTESIISENEPWNNKLIPEEPNPNNYKTFQEFEKALQRWSKIVLKSFKKIPPHATDFREIHGLVSLEEKRRDEERKKQLKIQRRNTLSNFGKSKNNLNLTFTKNFKNNQKRFRLSGKYPNSYRPWIINFHKRCLLYSPKQGLNALTSFQTIITQRYLSNLFKTAILKNGKQQENDQKGKNSFNGKNHRKFKTSQIEINILSSTFKQNTFSPNSKSAYIIKELLESLNENNTKNTENKSFRVIGILHGQLKNSTNFYQRKKHINSRSLSNFYLRRSDISGSLLPKSVDCPLKINGGKVIYPIPNYENDEPIDLFSVNKKNYQFKIKRSLNNFKSQHKFNKLNSSYYPQKFLQKKLNLQIQSIKDHFSNNVNLDKIGLILSLLTSNLPLDIFIQLMNETVFEKLSQKMFSEAIYSIINTKNLKKILQLFHHSISLLTHSKTSFFITGLLESHIGTKIIVNYSLNNDIQSLYYIAYAMNFLDCNVSNIHPYDEETKQYSIKIFGKKNWELEQKLFVYYYIRHILGPMLVPKKKFLYLSISSDIKKELTKGKDADGCKEKDDNMNKGKSKGKKKNKNKIKVKNLKSKSMSNINPMKKKTNGNDDNNVNTIENEDLICLDSTIFKKLMTHLLKLINNNTYTFELLIILTKLIYKLSFAMVLCCKIDIIQSHNRNKLNNNNDNNNNNNNNNNRSKWGKSGKGKNVHLKPFTKKQIFIDLNSFDTIFKIIENGKTELDLVKCYLVKTFTKFLQIPNIYLFLLKKEKCYSIFNIITKISISNRLSKSIWRFLYILIFSHPNALQHLIILKKFQNFLGMVSSVSSVSVVSHGLDFIHKLFMLPEKNHLKKLNLLNQISPININEMHFQLLKTHQLFIDFFTDNSMFVKLNMIFMKHGKSDFNTNRKITWFIFVKLSKVYYVLLDKSFCIKILKSNSKKEQYKEGFNTFESMIFESKSLESNSSSIAIYGKGKIVNFNDSKRRWTAGNKLKETFKNKKFRKWLKKK
ncbi:histone deacetylase rpd3 [Anaeramoeba flamelloides]|uniref:histone deacetylase n=1 Tax=Anaeramoeba flamelloides TaxID=1746091 RepID=A0ABQ8XEG2_9EUKA|nr:histone deacetylase rpd3 [Anaeramoeba flamelloides]